MGIMVEALAISFRSGNSTFAPSGWFMHACSHKIRRFGYPKKVLSFSQKVRLLKGYLFNDTSYQKVTEEDWH